MPFREVKNPKENNARYYVVAKGNHHGSPQKTRAKNKKDNENLANND